jgi:hypothetical protein
MEHHLTDDLERRLRAARPRAARVDEDAFDAALLVRLRSQPMAARRTIPRAVALPVAAGVTVTATAVVMLAGGPGGTGGPSSAAAISESLRWLSTPAGTILHVRSVETSGTQTTTREMWQSASDTTSEREVTEGAQSFETAGGALYDPATDTIYDASAVGGLPDGSSDGSAKPSTAADRAKQKRAVAGTPRTGKPGDGPLPAGDPIVDKVRILLQRGDMVVTGREVHNGAEAWAISLRPDAGRPVWTLWISAADGKPLELRDPGRDPSEQPQVIRWSTYEVLPGSDAGRLLTLTGAHPSAKVVRDPAQTEAAVRRLMPPKRR